MNDDDLIDYEHDVLEDRLQALQRLRISQLEQQLRIQQLEYELQSCQERNQYLEDQNAMLDQRYQEKVIENESLYQQVLEDKQVIEIQERKLVHLQQLMERKQQDGKYLSTMISTLQTDEQRNKQHLLQKLNQSRGYIHNVQSICLTLNDLLKEIFNMSCR